MLISRSHHGCENHRLRRGSNRPAAGLSLSVSPAAERCEKTHTKRQTERRCLTQVREQSFKHFGHAVHVSPMTH